ncbi:transcriptional regulator [Virgisporangium aliadipatigenens]|uniref:Transcriptional regulator n=1 Tax=Virgisporangium aliadipatigenens TaxID=741659 RepID=A0A8J3YT76_9ACTN|nr:MerR family transcriptional regulator [Virgisporangium aliadipatigenens]GIJ49998.1 transcriptional regulator [Virgisporangium aliadipatigenens]
MGDDGLTAGAVARRLGVAVTTLRTWHQRYNLGPSRHEPGRHRRYTDEDVARLELMQRLTADGVPPGEAARWVRERPMEITRPLRRAVSPARTLPAVSSAARDGGGLALPAAAPAARGLARAALRLDADAVRHIAGEAVRRLGVVLAWDAVLRPVMAAIGERHGRTGDLIDVEHLVSACYSDVFGAVPRTPPPDGRVARVLLACTDEEQHSLPIEATAAALAQAGVPSRMLGARVPPDALRTAVRRTGPVAMLLWSHHPRTAAIGQITAFTGERSRPMLIVAGGPGWNIEALPPGVATPRTLGEAVELLVGATK